MGTSGVSGKAEAGAGERTLLILPCFNEAGAIGGLLSEVQKVCPSHVTIVIDDCSTDQTSEIAGALSKVARLSQNLGIGGAVQTGIRYARLQNFDFCIQIDGDGQHRPDQIAKLFEAYRKQPSNITIGSRYLDGQGFQSTLARRMGARLISWALKSAFGRTVTDPTSGMRMMDKTAIRFFADHYPHDFPEPISLARAFRNGFTVTEAPVVMRSREHGSSSILGVKTLLYMIRVVSYIFIARIERKRPTRSPA